MWTGLVASNSISTVVVPPVNRRSLTPSGICVEHGKPVVLLLAFGREESELQNKLMGLRVKDAGESESRSVMERIGIANVLRFWKRTHSR